MKNGVNAKLIQNYIKKNNLSQKEFCDKCGIDVGTLNRMMSGTNSRLTSLLKVRAVMGVTLDSLLNLDK